MTIQGPLQLEMRSAQPFFGKVSPQSFSMSSVSSLALRYFRVLQLPYFLGYGLYEIASDHPPVQQMRSDGKIQQALYWFYRQCKSILTYGKVHGSLFIAVGLSETTLALERYHLLQLNAQTIIKLTKLSSALFLAANVLTFSYSSRLLYCAATLPKHMPDTVKQTAERVKIAASIALVSSSNYILGAAVAFAGGAPIIIVTFLCLGLAAGGTKLLFDFLRPYDPYLVLK